MGSLALPSQNTRARAQFSPKEEVCLGVGGGAALYYVGDFCESPSLVQRGGLETIGKPLSPHNLKSRVRGKCLSFAPVHITNGCPRGLTSTSVSLRESVLLKR